MNIAFRGVTFGTDPEIFFTNQKGEVIGAEKVLPKEGVWQMEQDYADPTGKTLRKIYKHAIIDGIAGELNPQPATCRQTFSRNLQMSFKYLQDHLTKTKQDVVISFARSVTISEHEMAALSPESQQLGCSPSLNAYGDFAMPVLTPENMYIRSAGGHLHFSGADTKTIELFKTKPQHVVRILDIILGNTCVLLDKDPGNATRRVMYGRAGEYRLPSHGLEYRVLSNFWLIRYTVLSLVTSLARFAIMIADDEKASAELLDMVNLGKIQEAINTNDYEMAYDNFNQIKKFLSGIHLTGTVDFFPLEGSRLAKFEVVVKKGLGVYFKREPLAHWLDHEEVGGSGIGWEAFIDDITLPKPKSLATKVMEAVTAK